MKGWLKRFFRKFVLNFRKNPLPTDIIELEKILSYTFKDRELITNALTHRSYAYTNHDDMMKSNERIEFLGDSVLELIVSENLFTAYPKLREGDLTKIRAVIVSKSNLSKVAGRIGISRYILLSQSEDLSGGRARASILADALEAIIGALYLDGGLKAAEEFITATLLPDIENGNKLPLDKNHKNILLEWVQANKNGYPIYKTISEEGPDHEKQFHIEVYVEGQSLGTGTGRSKKEAQQNAALDALKQLGMLKNAKRA